MLPAAHEILIKSVIAQESVTQHKRKVEKLRQEIIELEHDRKGYVF